MRAASARSAPTRDTGSFGGSSAATAWAAVSARARRASARRRSMAPWRAMPINQPRTPPRRGSKPAAWRQSDRKASWQTSSTSAARPRWATR